MVTKLFTLLFVITQFQQAASFPLRPKRSPRELQSHQSVLISTHPVLQQNYFSRNRGNIPLLAPIPLSQLYLHQKLHVIPANSNLVHGTLQHIVTRDNVNIPVLTQRVQQNTGNYLFNNTRPTLLPILIPLHSIVTTGNHLIPIHDLSVIPLQRGKVEQKVAHFRVAMEKKEENNEEPSNQYRNFYGGYGNGLFFGGHGSGHGFYAYGK